MRSGNYFVSVPYNPVTATVRINVVPAPLTVTAADASIVEGQATPAFTALYAGFVHGEGPGVLSGVLTFRTPVDTASHAGHYPITPGGLDSGNYAITYVDGTLTVAPRPILPLTVLGVHWEARKLGRKRKAKVLVVNFSDALDPAHVQDPGAYRLVTAGRDKRFGTRDDKPLALSAPAYDSSAHAVALTPRGKVPSQPLQLTIIATGTLDAQGQPIDGNHDGQPGGDFVANFGNAGISLASVSRSAPSSRVTAEAFDALLVAGRIPSTRGRRHGL